MRKEGREDGRYRKEMKGDFCCGKKTKPNTQKANLLVKLNFKLKVQPTEVVSSWSKYRAFRMAGTAHGLAVLPPLIHLSPWKTHLTPYP